MAAFTSKATGNWNAAGQTTWNEAGVPGLGDSATIGPSVVSIFTSKASGDWGSAGQTTWNEVGVPGLGDAVVINNTHTVTVSSDTSGGDGSSAAISIVSGGVLAIADGITLTVFGDIDNAGSIDSGAGSAIDFTSTGPTVTMTVTVTVNTTVGDGTASALSILVNGVLALAAGVTVTIFGAIDNAGAIDLGDGSSIQFTDIGPSTGGTDMYVETYIGTIHGQWIGSHVGMGGL